MTPRRADKRAGEIPQAPPAPRRRASVHAASPGPLGAGDPRQDAPTDLRLVVPALAAWAAAAAAPLLRAPVLRVGLALCLGTACALAWSGRRRWRPAPSAAGKRLAAAMTLACAAAGAASAGLHAADVSRGPVPRLAAERAAATVHLRITGDPRRTAPRIRGARRTSGVVLVPAEVTRVAASGSGVSTSRAPVLLLVTADRSVAATWQRLLPSTVVRADVRLAPPDPSARGRDLAAVLRTDGPPQRIRGPSTAQRAAGGLRAGLRNATESLAPDARALLPGLVVGDTSRVPEELRDAFRATDMQHLLAVSGGNLTILLVLLIGPPGRAARAERGGLAARFGLPLRATAVLAALVTLGFVLVCRPQPSVLRAAACGLITVWALGSGRRRSLLPALAAAVLALVLGDPPLAHDPGFLLSVLATASLLTVAPRWSAALRGRGVPGRLAEALAAAAAAQAACAPVVVLLSAHVSLVAVPCNLLAEFAVAPATVLGFGALLTAPLSPSLAEALAWLGGHPTTVVATVARTGASVPGATVEWPDTWGGALLLAALVVVSALLVRRVPVRAGGCAVLAAVLAVALFRPPLLTRTLTGWPPPGWRLVVCDVGQGDAVVLNAGEHAAVVVDAGPDPEAVDACLTDLGVRTVPLLVLTHFHADHVAGLPGVLRGRAVGAVQVTSRQHPPDQVAFVHRTAAAAGLPVIRARPGERRRTGPLRWRVLWPPAGTLPAGEEGEEANNASLTLLLRTGPLTVLLPGDLEPPAQRSLLETHPWLGPVDVLKVAHHGSAYQEVELLDRVHPRIALVSAGTGNPYGHPAPSTLRSLEARGAVVGRTDRSGSLAVTEGGNVVSAR
ncbi:ComEC/Rec2 family competence protein [Streptomyces sp. TR06-5]|uniref:ComEC/Rec2 family competence protein n=1 Tax=unclassified Streptomyces TaxID=2593676 RepID=UPI0039A34E73